MKSFLDEMKEEEVVMSGCGGHCSYVINFLDKPLP